MMSNWLSLVPPVLVILTAVATKRTKASLLMGIAAAVLIASYGSPAQSVLLAVSSLKTTLIDHDNLSMFLFLFGLGVLVALLNQTGGAAAFGKMITHRLKDQRSVETSCLLLSTSCFFDDYFNTLSVGCIMQPLADKFSIARSKMAYLIDSLAAPLAILIPVTSWVAVISRELGQFCSETGSGFLFEIDPYYAYICSAPFIFYSILTIMACWFIVRARISFGAMGRHERIAQEEGNLFGGKSPLGKKVILEEPSSNASAFDFFFPIVVLFCSIIGMVLHTGNYHISSGFKGILHAVQHSDIFSALFIGGTITLVISIVSSLLRKTIRPTQVPALVLSGCSLMLPAIATLYLAWTLSSLMKGHLHTGEYLASVFIGSTALALLPATLFIASLITAITTGSSWAAVSIIIPIALPMLHGLTHGDTTTGLALLFPIVGAILSGSVAGDHLSPLSDTTIMAATSSGAYLLDHAHTQLVYGLPVIFATGGAFLISGAMGASIPWYANAFISISLSSIACAGYYIIRHQWFCKPSQ